ncbi:MAG: nucleotide sugar dehydrogenase [Chloroflexi bacterium RBG_16_72_14]|nr:MAG: nucleotide sugar dehydrogenase [Chloroflexi bacterium RBG_16_72_14]
MVHPDNAAPLDVVVLGGGGHVGLPLSLAFASAGLHVGIYDINEATLERIGRGEMPFLEHGADQLLADVLPTGLLELSSDPAVMARADTVVVVIGTPVDEFLGPSMRVFERAVDQIAPHVRDGALIVLRSTVYPGTSEYVAIAMAERGCRVDVAFCPERIAEGHALEELRSLPQVVGADTPQAGDRAEALYRRLAAKTIRTTTREAELAKLFTNTWRYMKFAIANQFLAIADQAGVDYTNVLRAVREDYPRAADLPGPGFAAGPCLFKDTMQLAAFTADHFPLGQAAMQINEGMPAYIVSALERRHGSLRGRSIGILGMAFKAESDDIRASLSFKLRKLLEWAGARVLATDEYVTDDRLVPLAEVLERSEILIVGAPHRAYRSLDLAGREVVDIWNVTGAGIRL